MRTKVLAKFGAGTAVLMLAVGIATVASALAARSADARIAWNIALNINWAGDGESATEATFLEEDGVSLNNCGGCDFALEVDIDGIQTTTIAPGTTFGLGLGSTDPNPLALFDMPDTVVSFAEGSYGQTFTATASGTLDEARMNLACLVTDSVPTVFTSLFELNEAGDALVRQVARVPFPWDDCETSSSWDGSWKTADFGWVGFAFNAPVVSGTRYAVLFTGPAIGGFQPSNDLSGVDDGDTNGETDATTPVLSGGSAPTVSTGAGVWQLTDGTGVPLTASSPTARQIRYVADGLSVTFTGADGTSVANGLVADANGEVVCEVCVALASGQVIEVWMFSTPRLVAAHLTEDLPCQRFSIPVVAPLDGGGPVSAGAHTLQLALPTASGMQAVNVGVTVGGPVPVSVPAGEGPAPLGSVLIALLAAAGALLAGRRLVTAG